MKKTACLILSLIFILQFSLTAFAFEFNEDSHYIMEIPDSFSRVDEFEFKDDYGSTFNVSYEKNEKGESIQDKSIKKLQEETKIITDTMAEMFKAVEKEGKMECLTVEKIKHPNGMTACVRTFKTTCKTKDGEQVNFEKMYDFTGASKKYTFCFSTEKEEDLNSFDKSFDSIVINEIEAKSIGDKILTYGILAIVIVLIVVGIIKFVSPAPQDDKKKNKEVKLKGEKK